MPTSKEKAIDYLSRREHSRLELKRKLRTKKFTDEDIASTLDELAHKNYQSDERFAESYVRYRKQSGFGPLRIMAELRERGVSDAIIQKNINVYEAEWRAHMTSVFERKFTKVAVSLKEKAKQGQFLASRGFAADDIYALLR
jgi:regulatory protein